jgi:hypothetical protein
MKRNLICIQLEVDVTHLVELGKAGDVFAKYFSQYITLLGYGSSPLFRRLLSFNL